MQPKFVQPQRSRARGRQLAILVMLCSVALGHAARASEHLSALRFSTTDQPLFGSFGGRDELVDIDLRFIDEHVPPTSKGRIERVTEEVPVTTLQNIWQRALDQCMAQSFTVPVVGATISPTMNECITGTVSRPYCTVPPKLDWSFPCVDERTYTRTLGAGIGPRPTQPANRPFDVGAIVTYEANVEMGVRGNMVLDGGTIDFSLRSYVFTDVNATATYAGVDFETGDQIRATRVLYDADTLDSDLENVSADGIVEFADTEWFGVNVSPAGLVVRVKEQGLTVADGSTLISDDILYPFQPKGVPRPVGQAGFSLADYSLLSPKLDTPAVLGFNCGGCVDPPLRNFVDYAGRIVNTTPVGPRTLIQGLVGENGLELP